MMNFPDGFDANMACQLREREPVTMKDMQKMAVSVEANFLSKRAKMKFASLCAAELTAHSSSPVT